MPETVTLKRDMPGLPAGTVLTLEADGRYRDTSRKSWFDQTIESDESAVEVPMTPDEAYWFVNDGLVAEAVTWTAKAADRRRRQAGNFFRRQDRAERLAARIREALVNGHIGIR